ncbi:MAG: ABC transporter substrate binding protein [Thermodesulfovibrionales bacterium]|nr:ABC transporter substrate binding protein [Thermodesulfovibrionales bacterium]
MFLFVFIFIAAYVMFFSVSFCESADVIIIGDTQLRPVNEIISGIRENLDSILKIYLPSDVKGRLNGIAAREEARVVIALGRDALEESLKLPSSIAVIYDLVITPPEIDRPNTTGIYMATPVKEYVDLIKSYLPQIRRIAVVGSHGLMRILDGTANPHVSAYSVRNSFEFVHTVKQVDSAGAILLLPDVGLLTDTAIEEVFLASFRKNIPILGISEKHVKHGALLALTFNPANVGRHLGEKAARALKGVDMGTIPPSPSNEFDLYINTNTARRMGIHIPAELLRKAKRIYP